MRPTRVASVIAVLAVCSLAPGRCAAALDASALPRCWTVTSTTDADDAQLAGFEGRFGVDLDALSNTKIDAAGVPLQVNVITCASAADAARVHEYFMTARNATPMKYIQDDNLVYEFLCDHTGVRAKMQDVLGLYPREVRTYRVTMEVAPLARSDDSRWNALFNALAQSGRDPDDVVTVERALQLAAGFEFSERIALRNERPEWGAPAYSFSVAPRAEAPRGDVLEVTFDELPRVVDVPRVTIEATVPVRPFSVYQPPEPVNAYDLTRATDPWPMASREVMKAFYEGWDPAWPFSEKIEYIQCWVNEKIEYAGDAVGSRYGVLKTLEQGYGHCWDKSDVFISICRRAEIPARQVMGWHVGLQQGHVWAQVYDPSSGWVSVDPSASWVGLDVEYVPLFVVETGHPSFVYTSVPIVAVVAADHSER